MRTWLILDMDNLCYRNFFAIGGMSWSNAKDSVLYGLYRDIQFLSSYFATDSIAFCFDHGRPKRKDIMDQYKSNRLRHLLPEMEEAKSQVRETIDQIRETILPELGYRNVFSQDGYEADDCIAAASHNLGDRERAVIVSSDDDLLQLLSPGVVIYKPKEKTIITEESFQNKWKITSTIWPEIKALAGCTSDNIPGCPRVGEITAVKFFRGDLNQDTEVYRKAFDWVLGKSRPQYVKNLRLVKLPFEGCPPFHCVCHPLVTESMWNCYLLTIGVKFPEPQKHQVTRR